MRDNTSLTFIDYCSSRFIHFDTIFTLLVLVALWRGLLGSNLNEFDYNIYSLDLIGTYFIT